MKDHGDDLQIAYVSVMRLIRPINLFELIDHGDLFTSNAFIQPYFLGVWLEPPN